MQFALKNEGKQIHTLYDAGGRAVVMPPGFSRSAVELRDTVAVLLRRLQMKGSKITILAIDEEGEKLLEKANEPPRKKKPFRMVHGPGESPDEILRAARARVPPIKDELADVSVHDTEPVEAAARDDGEVDETAAEETGGDAAIEETEEATLGYKPEVSENVFVTESNQTSGQRRRRR